MKFNCSISTITIKRAQSISDKKKQAKSEATEKRKEEVTHVLENDMIVDISESQIGYFGGPGKMLIPSMATVEAMVKAIPEHKLMTTSQIRKKLADQYKVRGTCPVTTRKALQMIANERGKSVPYWRVIKQSGELMSLFPGGMEGQAELLKQEGFDVESKEKVLKVERFRQSLV